MCSSPRHASLTPRDRPPPCRPRAAIPASVWAGMAPLQEGPPKRVGGASRGPYSRTATIPQYPPRAPGAPLGLGCPLARGPFILTARGLTQGRGMRDAVQIEAVLEAVRSQRPNFAGV